MKLKIPPFELIKILALLISLFLLIKPVSSHPGKRSFKSLGNDSIPFAINSTGGWSIYPGTYISPFGGDSVDVEVVLQHAANINWSDEQLIGFITDSSFFPKTDQVFSFYLMSGNTWNVHIAASGNCYISRVTGSEPEGDPGVLPIKAHFRYK